MQVLFGLTVDDELSLLLMDIIQEYSSREPEDKLDLIECIRESAL